MKVEITEKGVNRNGVAIAKGRVIEIDGDRIPGSLVGKCRVIGDEPERVAVTNPADGAVQEPFEPSAQERQTLLGEAAKLLDDDQFSADGVPDVRAINALLDYGAKKFTASERDHLWPGIADAVKAARG